MIVAIPEPVKREEDPEGRRVIGINASAPYYAGFMDIMWKKLPKMVEDGAVVVRLLLYNFLSSSSFPRSQIVSKSFQTG